MKRRQFCQLVGATSTSYLTNHYWFSPALALPAAIPEGTSPRPQLTARWFENSQPLMGTFVSIALLAESESKARTIIDETFSYAKSKIAEISSWDEQSFTSNLNHNRSISLSSCPQTFVRLLQASSSLHRTTKGAFNPYVLKLTELWRQVIDNGAMPTSREVALLAREARFSSCQVSNTTVRPRIELCGEGNLDFAGIGKGFIADLCREYLQDSGVNCARIDCGGDLAFLGPQQRWEVDIIHPRKEALLGTAKVYGSSAIATSGDYIHCRVSGQTRIHHLLDINTGSPANFSQSVSILAPSATTADALATALSCLPLRDAVSIINSSASVEALIVSASGEIFKTPGFNFSLA